MLSVLLCCISVIAFPDLTVVRVQNAYTGKSVPRAKVKISHPGLKKPIEGETGAQGEFKATKLDHNLGKVTVTVTVYGTRFEDKFDPKKPIVFKVAPKLRPVYQIAYACV